MGREERGVWGENKYEVVRMRDMYDLSRTLALKLPYLPSLTSPLQQLLICFNQFIMGRTQCTVYNTGLVIPACLCW